MTQRSDSRTFKVSSLVRADRTRHGLELVVRWRCASWAEFADLHAGQLSVGGLFAGSRIAVPVGTAVLVELTLPDGEIIELPTEVVPAIDESGAKTPGTALAIGELGGRAQQALDAAVAQLRTQTRPRPVAPPPPPIARVPHQPTRTQPPAPLPLEERAPLPLSAPVDVRAPLTRTAAAFAAAPAIDDFIWGAPVELPPADSRPIPIAPPPAPPAPLAPAPMATPQFASEVEQALLDELGRRMELTPHAQLGLPLDADDDAIIAAHGALKERYAPATFARYGAGTAVVVKGLHELIDAAFSQLADLERRQALIAAAQAAAVAPPPETVDKQRRGSGALNALRSGIERRVQEACAHRDMGRIDEAIRAFESVLALDKKNDYATEELKQLRHLKSRRKL